jgi:hypothetical protein
MSTECLNTIHVNARTWQYYLNLAHVLSWVTHTHTHISITINTTELLYCFVGGQFLD